MEIKEMVEDLASMVLNGKAMEAFEKYYADDVVMQENDNPLRQGKDASREFEKEFFSNIKEFHGAEVRNIAIGDNGVAMIEWFMDVTFKDGARKKMTEVAVQQWKDGKIVREKFYYDSNPPGN